jgi:type VI secretion system protein VasJ
MVPDMLHDDQHWPSESLTVLGTEPISTDRPAGTDVRYDPAFEELQAEIDKLTSPALAGSINWARVARRAAEILAHKSKDLLVASYLVVALIHTRGSDGCAVGLKLYSDLITFFWNDLYPPKSRPHGRIRALQWWLEKTESALKQSADISFLPEQLEVAREALKRLDSSLHGRMENAPSLIPIQQYFDSLIAGKVRPGEEEPPARAVTGKDVQEPGGAAIAHEQQNAATSQTISSPQEADKVLSDGLMRVSEASYYFWQQDTVSPQFYRLTRQAAWYSVDELPPATKGRTRIPPPPSHVKDLLRNLSSIDDPEALLKATETRQPEYIFWLDLSRLAVESLGRLGDRFAKAREAVCQETAFLLHRLPGLEELTFADGTPFADAETRQWLRGIALRRGSSEALSLDIGEPPDAATTEAAMLSEIAQLQQLASSGKLSEALEIFQQKLRVAQSRRENLLWRLSVSRMLVDLGKSRLALPHLEQVLEDIGKHGLEQYDPNLALRGLKLVWLALDSQREQRFKDRAQEVLHQIGRLDLPAMARLAESREHEAR